MTLMKNYCQHQINKENIQLHKNAIWDIMEIDWRPVIKNIEWECN